MKDSESTRTTLRQSSLSVDLVTEISEMLSNGITTRISLDPFLALKTAALMSLIHSWREISVSVLKKYFFLSVWTLNSVSESLEGSIEIIFESWIVLTG